MFTCLRIKPFKPSLAPKKCPKNEDVMAMKAINGPKEAIKALSFTFARYDKTDIFCTLASNNCAGVRLNTQEKTKNTTNEISMIDVRLRICSDFSPACLP
ncbi:Chromosome partition protein Smc [Moritella viscosa]|nr:Chromosome partition protein Smc [Moritella viscosa]